MTPLQQGGAKIVLTSQTPTIDLVSLVEQVTAAIQEELPSSDGKLPPEAEQLFAFATDGRQSHGEPKECSLTVNTAAVIHRLIRHQDFRMKFVNGPDTGFIRDREAMPRGRDTIVGGKVHAGKVQELPQAVAALRDVVEQALDACLERQGVELSGLLRQQAGEYMKDLGRKIKAKSPGEDGTTTIAALRFTDPEGKQRPADKARQVARLFSAREEVHTEWFTGFLSAARRKLERQGLEPDEMEAVLDNFRQEADLPTSQTARFLNFLEDDAMARVRMEVCFAFMRAVRDEVVRHAKSQDKALIHYISNILEMKECFFDTEKALVFELGGLFEGLASINLSDRMRRSLFYSCLPIWPQPKAQLFESRKSEDNALVREVSYRFRINGLDPQTGLTALNRRLEEINKIIKGQKERNDPGRLEKALSQMLYLSLVIPNGEKLDQHIDIPSKCDVLIRYITENRDNALPKLIEHLQKQETNGTMPAIVGQLIQALRQHGGAAIEKARHRADQLPGQGQQRFRGRPGQRPRAFPLFRKPGRRSRNHPLLHLRHPGRGGP